MAVESTEVTVPVRRVWGPILEARARGAGALAAASSVLLQPLHPPTTVIAPVQNLIPAEVLPRKDDTAKSLRARIQASSFFHKSMVLKHGNGTKGGYVDLNTTEYAQPRRVQWAKPPEPAYVDEDGDEVVMMPCYPHYYRQSPLQAICEPMPPAIEDLVSYAFEMARPFLTSVSRSRLPDR